MRRTHKAQSRREASSPPERRAEPAGSLLGDVLATQPVPLPHPPHQVVGLDVHRSYVVIAAVDANQQVVLRPRRLSLDQFASWIHEHLEPTDARDTVNLARLLAAGRIPAAWVPPAQVRDLRVLMTHRRRLIQQRTRARNRVAICYLLGQQVADRHGEPVAVAQKLMRWATYRRMATRQGLSRRHFVRRQLDQLGLGADLDHLPFHGKRLRLPRIESAQLALPAG